MEGFDNAIVLGGKSEEVFTHFKNIRQAIEDLHIEHSGYEKEARFLVVPLFYIRVSGFCPQPSMLAASSRSFGTSIKNWRNM